jgi:hypothetical protein
VLPGGDLGRDEQRTGAGIGPLGEQISVNDSSEVAVQRDATVLAALAVDQQPPPSGPIRQEMLIQDLIARPLGGSRSTRPVRVRQVREQLAGNLEYETGRSADRTTALRGSPLRAVALRQASVPVSSPSAFPAE